MRRFVGALRPLRTLALSRVPTTLRVLSTASSSSSSSSSSAAAAAADASSDSDSAAAAPGADFDSSEFSLPPSSEPSKARNPVSALRKLRFDPSLRARADVALFGKERGVRGLDEAVEEERSREVALALLEAALEPPDEDDDVGPGEIREEDQMSLSVGIVGAPNAGKSSLTNTMVGTKVAAVSRKTNTTTHEIWVVFFDTPGLMLGHHGFPHRDVTVRVESAWSSINLYDLLIVMFDVSRHLKTPDSRVIKLIKRLGTEVLHGIWTKGKGVKDLVQFLTEQAVRRPWDEEPTSMTEEVMKTISLEVVREKMLDHIHQEIPYVIEHRLMDWKELKDGSLRVEHHFIAPKQSQRHILVGKNGSKIGRIGIEANEELRGVHEQIMTLVPV
ncbi:hypothetical protein GUJ93_ZPchr0010g7510 [Zizania palustris]|uniref:Uncharacterized protein n=1 Tax=Zizania palustris TaxID=103762 RepID=A0A8J5WAH4_ZIZPA|nr:hypothetical protein GUJ93_ZPchr0010g7510 [Zizania palustris]